MACHHPGGPAAGAQLVVSPKARGIRWLICILQVQSGAPADIKVGADLTKSNRTASGKMVMEYITTKRRGRRLALFRRRSAGHHQPARREQAFFHTEYPDAGGQQTMTCYAGDINTSLWHISTVRRWSEVQSHSSSSDSGGEGMARCDVAVLLVQ